MQRRRLLILNWRDIRNPLAGGAETHIWKVFGAAARQGWEAVAITARYRGCAAYEVVDGIRVFRFGAPYTYNLSLPLAYRRVCRDFQPDLVVEFLNKLPLFTPLYVRRPLVCFVHHLFGDASTLELSLPVAAVLKGYERFIPRVYARTPMLAGSSSTRDELVELGLPERRLHIVPFGTDTEAYRPGPKSEHPAIAYVGRIKRYKGIDHLLRVVPRLIERFSTLKVHIAGQGDDAARLQALATSLGLASHVVFHGFITEAEKQRLYQQAWVMCCPSVKEGFGLTIPEAALSGTPTVAYDVPGLRDSVRHGETGLLVPYGNLEALRDALAQVLSDEALRQRLSHSARETYRDFSWERASKETLAVLEEILDEKHKGHAVAEGHSWSTKS